MIELLVGGAVITAMAIRDSNRASARQVRQEHYETVVEPAGVDEIDIQGSKAFKRQMRRYIEQLCKSSKGRKVFSESGLTTIRQTNGVNSFSEGTELQLGMIGGYAVFCHELRHCWQRSQGWDMWDWNRNENDANAFSTARCLEAGDLIGAALGVFMIFEPISKLTNAVYYSR